MVVILSLFHLSIIDLLSSRVCLARVFKDWHKHYLCKCFQTFSSEFLHSFNGIYYPYMHYLVNGTIVLN